MICLALALLDWWRPMPNAARLILWLVSLAWLFIRYVNVSGFRWWSRTGLSADWRVLIERRYPELDGRLLTAVESPDHRHDDVLWQSTQEKSLRPGGLWKTSWWTQAGIAVCVILTVIGVSSSWAAVAGQRILTPWRSVAWPASVGYELTLEQGSLALAGQSVWLRIDRAFGVDEAVTLSWLQADQKPSPESLPSFNDPSWNQKTWAVTHEVIGVSVCSLRRAIGGSWLIRLGDNRPLFR